MTKLKLLTLGVVLLVFSSCGKEPAVSIPGSDPSDLSAETSTHRMSQGEAVAILENFMATMNENGSPATRSVAQPRISQVRTAISSDYSNRAERTRSSGSEEVLFYEMSLENGDGTEGFAVVVGDQRFPEVIAYCPSGSLADTVNIPAMAMFFREAAEILGQEIIPEEINILSPGGNPTGTPSVDHMQPESTVFYIQSIESTVAEYYYWTDKSTEADVWWINKTSWYSDSWVDHIYDEASVPYRWHQGAPYNKKVPVSLKGVKAPIGCVPLAVGTIMAYHRHPNIYNWNAITQSISVPTSNVYIVAQNAVSQMLYDVAGLLGTSWSFDTSGIGVGITIGNGDGGIAYIRPTFGSLGYTYEESANGSLINKDSLINNFNRGLPVMISSRGTLNGKDSGHGWIIDGLMVRKRYFYNWAWANHDFISGTGEPASIYYIRQRECTAHMMHCLWGWEGEECNGWYFTLVPIGFSRGNATFSGYNKTLYTNIKPA